ncbi:Fe-S cluster assembly protein SufD [Umezakia ovalisporum]|uniref:Fe-S cluster assembly protein SufD n=1 Tax=Umezakia ovalisporum FSS-43 TaxID=2740520 RepID=A0ABT6K7D1_9CYAN|nr:Fe-S cluster assembly protein SufD [Umezakia ovalisporum]MDH6058250.1 Fe-S cluster assembly protein SufD [Umezakia ovalisporum FSS-43]MDH6072363.1 Fe-S cluster assembly protein SufD [Umezakia ovalisporum CobakiLakeA]MDH6077590.1 Fe-S cluster assembly protein SufD [Umezakia ovalisporum FSS-45]MDH6081592.1 Fe-S cluster assembly protein SufD [Umezakia ovalisporum FSS-44]MDH6094804.1 Fe-S cluster assembly protein SufD [Umezakia ovalisporum CobakiLakeB]
MTTSVSPTPAPSLDKDTYLTNLLAQVTTPTSVAWLQELRQGAVNWVRHSTIPTTRAEEWRFTNLSALGQVQFHLETQPQSVDISALILPEAANSRLVFVNNIYTPHLSAVGELPPGVVVGNLANFSPSQQENIKQYLAQAEGSQEVFTALNTAGISDAAVVWVPKNVILTTPIHLLFISVTGEQEIISQPRCLVVAETNSSVTLVEDFTHPQSTTTPKPYFTNAVTEIWLGDNAQISHTRIEREHPQAFHIGKTAVTQSRHSQYTSHALTFGAKLSRHNLEIFQAGEDTVTTLNGLTMITKKQLADTHSAIALNYPHGTSTQLHKCIVDHHAHAVFNGKVFVPKPAQLTNASQLNQNLLLSSKAKVDTKPQLEITADNVKCAHGATVSQLEEDEIFYLQSRGINENDARKLLINAFAAEIINQVPVKSLQQILFHIVNSLQSLSSD